MTKNSIEWLAKELHGHGKNQRTTTSEKTSGGFQGSPECPQGCGLYHLNLPITFPVRDSLRVSAHLCTELMWDGKAVHLSGSP